MRHFLWLAGFTLLLAAGYFFNSSAILSPDVKTQVVASDCDLRRGGCLVEITGEQWQLRLSPEDFDVLQPLEISLKKMTESGADPDAVRVQFEGINMDMGYNVIKLQSVSAGLFHARGMLPDCTAETMYWLVHLIVTSGGKQADFQFRLQT